MSIVDGLDHRGGFDLGAVAPQQVPDAVERCLYRRLLTTDVLWRLLDELGGRGRRRAGPPLRRALEHRALGDDRPESLLEPLLASISRDAGVAFEYQFPVVLDGHRCVVDFAVPHLLLACEVDGLSAHGTRKALDHDLERQNRLVRHGWTVLRFTATHLRRRRPTVKQEIRTTIAQLQVGRLAPVFEPRWLLSNQTGSKNGYDATGVTACPRRRRLRTGRRGARPCGGRPGPPAGCA